MQPVHSQEGRGRGMFQGRWSLVTGNTGRNPHSHISQLLFSHTSGPPPSPASIFFELRGLFALLASPPSTIQLFHNVRIHCFCTLNSSVPNPLFHPISTQGSMPSERVQNCIKQKHRELYNFVVSTVYANQWHRFVRKHEDVFELIFSKEGDGRGLPRIRLRAHENYQQADAKEEGERKRRETVCLCMCLHRSGAGVDLSLS